MTDAPPATRDAPRDGETCTCGRPAAVVYLTGDHGRVPYCGIPDGGRQRDADERPTN